MNARRIPLTDRQYAVPLTLITSLFFLWALGVNLNDILIPHLKKAFRLTDLQSSLIQTAYILYFAVKGYEPAGTRIRAGTIVEVQAR